MTEFSVVANLIMELYTDNFWRSSMSDDRSFHLRAFDDGVAEIGFRLAGHQDLVKREILPDFNVEFFNGDGLVGGYEVLFPARANNGVHREK